MLIKPQVPLIAMVRDMMHPTECIEEVRVVVHFLVEVLVVLVVVVLEVTTIESDKQIRFQVQHLIVSQWQLTMVWELSILMV